MTREEAIEVLKEYRTIVMNCLEAETPAFDMAIEALSADTVSREAHYDAVANRITDMEERGFVSVVRCKDCRHAGECHKSVQYTRNEPNTVTIGYTKIDFCSHGERREK